MPPARLAGDLEGDGRSWNGSRPLARCSPRARDEVAELRIRRQQLTLEREQLEPIPDLIVRGGSGYSPRTTRPSATPGYTSSSRSGTATGGISTPPSTA